MKKKKQLRVMIMGIFILSITVLSVQAQHKKKARKKEIYFSWGYNKEWYTNSTLKINQPSLGNNYSYQAVKGNDHPGWNEGLFSKALTIPQYNYRLGLFLNKKKNIAVEINFDHTKFIFADQQVAVKGTYNNKQIDSTINFNAKAGFYYYLNNGANFLLVNIVKRWHWLTNKKGYLKIDMLSKAGIGPVIPHVENSFFGQPNKPNFQFGGWNIGLEAAVRATLFNHVFLEYSNKLDYARYSNLKVYEGTAKHNFGTYEMILSLGFSFPVGSKIK
jgi:hypothetical protein